MTAPNISPGEWPRVQVVLDTAELLEIILLELDMKTLLFSQAVSKTFKTTTKASLKLQQEFFLKALPDHGGAVTTNPLLAVKYEKHFGTSVRMQHRSPSFRLWEFRKGRCRDVETGGERAIRRAKRGRRLRSDEWKLWEGSWRRMLLTQPPRHWAGERIDCDAPESIYNIFSRHVRVGQTAGEVFDGMLVRRNELVRQCSERRRYAACRERLNNQWATARHQRNLVRTSEKERGLPAVE